MSAPTSTKLLSLNIGKFSTAMLVYRNEQGYTRQKFGKIIGIPDHAIERIEVREATPSAEVLVNFCNISGQDIHSFFD